MFTLPPLPYPYDAIEPVLSAETMHIHHDVHHRRYVDACNRLTHVVQPLLGSKSFDFDAVAALIRDGGLPDTPDAKKFRENFGQHLNHSLFWRTLRPPGQHVDPKTWPIESPLIQLIRNSNDSFIDILPRIIEQGATLFGSGWIWLARTPNAKVVTLPLPNGENPAFYGLHPLLVVDVWEHAYYLDYGPERRDYLSRVLYEATDWLRVEERATNNRLM